MAQDQLDVSIEGGTVRGTAHGDLVSFKGIPFAQPPVGALRWRAPQPVKPWQGVRDASKFGPDAVQLPTEGMAQQWPTSEDCLYLNVWRPAGQTGQPLPVLVWIYGGAGVRGRGSRYVMDWFTRQGGMVVVSFNYRENRLGFFAHPALAAEAPEDPRGNYAFMDQIAALHWVRRNIAAFGGDPGTVTIAGESAGGGSVLALMISPMARGLFHRAILESPGLPSPRDAVLSLRSLDSAESRAVEYARDAGIDGKDRSALAALRAVPAEKVAEDGVDFAAAVVEYRRRSADTGLYRLDGRRAAGGREARGGAARWPAGDGAGDLRGEQLRPGAQRGGDQGRGVRSVRRARGPGTRAV